MGPENAKMTPISAPMRPLLPLVTASLLTSAVLLVDQAPARAALLDERPKVMSFRLDSPDSPRFSLLAPFRDASVERLGPLRLYTSSAWGSWTSSPWWKLAWRGPDQSPLTVQLPRPFELGDREGPSFRDPSSPFRVGSEPLGLDIDGLDLDASDADPPVARFGSMMVDPRGLVSTGSASVGLRVDAFGTAMASNGFDLLFKLPPKKPVVDWRCRRSPVQFLRYGNEGDKIELVRCDGTTAPGALDRLSILARPPEVKLPDGVLSGGGLPDEPDPEAWKSKHEWVDGVHIMHPRLLWALQRLADAFPRKGIYIYSGYRPFAEVNDGSGHQSLHASGRAIDISFFHVPNAEVFKACRDLKDVGCGYYPHGKFIHVDVRRAHSGKASWIDASEPGEQAKYVDSWPGVVDAPVAAP